LRAQLLDLLRQPARDLHLHRGGHFAELLRDVFIGLDRGLGCDRVNEDQLGAVLRGERGSTIDRLIARYRNVGAGEDRRELHSLTTLSSIASLRSAVTAGL